MSFWPWTEVIAGFMKYCYSKEKNKLNVLELGAGTGANTFFFSTLDNVEYHSIDISEIAVEISKSRFPKLSDNIKVGSFKDDLEFETGYFDLVFDRAAITHSNRKSIDHLFSEIKRVLRFNGLFLGVDWFSVKSDYCSQRNYKLSDIKEHFDFKEGIFKGLGVVNFFEKKDIEEIAFNMESDVIYLQHKIQEKYLPKKEVHAFWDFILQKNEQPE